MVENLHIIGLMLDGFGNWMGGNWLLWLNSIGELMGAGYLMPPNIPLGFTKLRFGWIGMGLIGVEFTGVA